LIKRYKPTPKEEASNALGLGESWYIMKDEDANEDLEILEGADAKDGCDLVPEVERFRATVDNAKIGFNQRMRGFFEGEKVKRY
jgi:hypothetical protein